MIASEIIVSCWTMSSMSGLPASASCSNVTRLPTTGCDIIATQKTGLIACPPFDPNDQGTDGNQIQYSISLRKSTKSGGSTMSRTTMNGSPINEYNTATFSTMSKVALSSVSISSQVTFTASPSAPESSPASVHGLELLAPGSILILMTRSRATISCSGIADELRSVPSVLVNHRYLTVPGSSLLPATSASLTSPAASSSPNDPEQCTPLSWPCTQPQTVNVVNQTVSRAARSSEVSALLALPAAPQPPSKRQDSVSLRSRAWFESSSATNARTGTILDVRVSNKSSSPVPWNLTDIYWRDEPGFEIGTTSSKVYGRQALGDSVDCVGSS